MAKPKKGPRLGAGPQHQKLLLANQASDLFRHGRIRTTEAKAKQLRPYAERLITKAKRGDLHARRQVLSKLRDRDVVAYLFEDIGPRFADRNGGYTRILKLAPRQGDNARMALIELVDQGDVHGDEEIEEAKRQRARGLFGRLRRDRDTAADEPGQGFDEVEEELEDENLPDLEDAEESPPGVDGELDASDLPDELEDEEQKGPGPEGPPSKGDDLRIPDEQREINPDAGDTTGA